MTRTIRPPVVCAWCCTWVKPPRRGEPQGALVSHGICPRCVREQFPERRALLSRLRRALASLGRRLLAAGGMRAW